MDYLLLLVLSATSISGQLSDRMNYRIEHPIIILLKYPGCWKTISRKQENCSKDYVLRLV